MKLLFQELKTQIIYNWDLISSLFYSLPLQKPVPHSHFLLCRHTNIESFHRRFDQQLQATWTRPWVFINTNKSLFNLNSVVTEGLFVSQESPLKGGVIIAHQLHEGKHQYEVKQVIKFKKSGNKMFVRWGSTSVQLQIPDFCQKKEHVTRKLQEVRRSWIQRTREDPVLRLRSGGSFGRLKENR